MDKKKTQRSKSPRQSSRSSGVDQQAQLALAQQLGVLPEFADPSLMSVYGVDPQQMLNPMAAAAAGYPFMNPAALQAFSGLGALGGQAGSGMHPGGVEWWNMAQNQTLAASLGAGFYPGMLPPGFAALAGSDVSQRPKSSSSDAGAKSKTCTRKPADHSQRTSSPFSAGKSSPRPGSSGASHSRLQQDHKRSYDSPQSGTKEATSSRHSLNSPFHSTHTKHSSPVSNTSWNDNLNNQRQQKLSEHMFQAEIMRQLEQQFLVQQLQLQQQQQQDQLTAVLQSAMSGSAGSLPGSSNKKSSSGAEKTQQQMASMLQQLMQGGASSALPPGISPAVASSLFSTPGALEAMMAMNQMGNIGAVSGLGGSNVKQEERMDHGHKSPSTSHKSSYPSSSREEKLFSPSSHSKAGTSSPQKPSSRAGHGHVSKNLPMSYPGMPDMGLSPDNALLAALYSQQLQQQQQYEALIKQEMEAVNRLREQDVKSNSGDPSKSRPRVKQEPHLEGPRLASTSKHEFATPSAHSRANLYSPANSASSRGKSHTSPTRDSSQSPSRRFQVQERSHSRGSASSSTLHHSPSRRSDTLNSATKSRRNFGNPYGPESMSETLKLFSALASNPNLTQQELAALMSLPPGADPTTLVSGMNHLAGFPLSATGFDPQISSQLSPSELEKLNKDIAAALAYETQKLEEQLRHQKVQIDNKSKRDKENDNHISVIHQNNLPDDTSNQASSSHSQNDKAFSKTSADQADTSTKMGNGDAGSSDCDAVSENSADRNRDSPSDYRSRKRRRVITNEEEVMEPLKHGWEREVRFKFLGNQLRGEVLYISPSGKKFRTFPDVMKHLEDNNITNLHRDNFSFSSRLRIGSFYEQKERASRKWFKMTEEELDQRIQQLDGHCGSGQSSSPFAENADQSSDHSSSSKSEVKQLKKEKDQGRDRHAEQMKFLRQQEKLQKLEQQRIEREIRERIAIEERQKLEEARKLKYQEALLKAKELERQRMAEALDRDQRRQQMLLMRALESRKRAEERERRKEEIRIEKMLQREKKMEQRRIAMQIARELKMPVEDMSTIGAPELPKLTQLQGTLDNKCPHQLSGNACADLLMVLEFVKTFKDCLRIEDAIVPTFEQLQRGLLNDPSHTPVLVQITMTLLHQCLCDPGVPAPGPWLHCLTGVKVTDIDVQDDNYSEILRLFIWARSGYKTEIALRLETLPFPSLTTDEKAQSLAFLVNELVCSRPICTEIERNLDAMATLRRDKWMVEGQMRQLRMAHEKNNPSDSLPIKLEDDENSNSSLSPRKSLVKSSSEIMKEDPQPETAESLFQKKMEELTQQHNSCSSQLVHNSKPLRALDLGQDRYKRRYWVLPNLGGVYVEGLESGISYEDDEESPDEDEGEDIKETEKEKEVETRGGDNAPEEKEKGDAADMETESGQKALADDESNTENAAPAADGETTGCESNKERSTDEMDSTPYPTDNVLMDADEAKKDVDELTQSGAIASDDKTEISSNVTAELNIPESSMVSHDSAKPLAPMPQSPPEVTTSMTESHSPQPNETTVPAKTKSHASAGIQDVECLDKPESTTTPIEEIANKNTTGTTSSCGSSVVFQDNDAVGDFDLCDNIDDDSADASSPDSVNPDNSASDKLDFEPDAEENSQACSSSLMHESQTPPDEQPLSTSVPCDAQTVSELDVVSLARLGAMRDLRAQDEVVKVGKDEDNVLVAAKAIAAKAVASSSHLLFPTENEVPTKSSPEQKEEAAAAKDKGENSPSQNGNGTAMIGSHTISALVQMGVNPTSLTSQQLEVLSHLDIPVSTAAASTSTAATTATDKKSEIENGCGPQDSDTKSESAADPCETKSEDKKDAKKESQKPRLSVDQDAPMDLSRPTGSLDRDSSLKNNQKIPPSSSLEALKLAAQSSFHSLSSAFMTPSGLNFTSVKQEQHIPGHGTPFAVSQDSSDSRYSDNQFFVPISFPNNVKMDPCFTTQSYNQILSSCPSPNTLANFIVSTANYSQFPSFEDIKFPIRAPDVKEEADTIPREKKRGWWRMESESELRSVSEKLHLRGIREKQLHRNITKNFEACTNSMTVATSPEHQFAVFTKPERVPKSPEKDEKMTDVEKVRKSTRSSSQERKNDGTNFSVAEKTAFESEMRGLIQVEELAMRCCNMAIVSPQWRTDNPRPSMCRKDLKHVPLGPLRDAVGNDIKFDITNPIIHHPTSALGVAVDLLGILERAVCRRYLKPPLVRKGGASEFSSLPSLSESGAMDVAAGLRTWRNAVAASTSASQLSLCVRMLEICIAWDRSANSPAKVEVTASPKTKKRKAEKRPTAKSALDADIPTQPKKKRKKKTNASKNTPGGATDGKKNKQSRMPIDTADVISKAVPGSGEDSSVNDTEVLLVNGDKNYQATTAVFSNSICPPINNIENSVASADSGVTHTHNSMPHNFGGTMSPRAEYHTNSDNVSDEYKPNAESKKKKKKKKSKKLKTNPKNDEDKKTSKEKKKPDKDTVMCRSILRELQSHEAATWFLFPVDCKLVPGYRKIIKKPIDFHTIESRLKKGRYKSVEDFVSEVRLVFDNCQKFNEDDSNIGRAGHSIRDFFERRWAEVTKTVNEGGAGAVDTALVQPIPEPATNSVLDPEGPEGATIPVPTTTVMQMGI